MSKLVDYLKEVSEEFYKLEKQDRRYVVVVKVERLKEVVKKLRELSKGVYLSTISGVDLPEEGVIEVNYCFWSVDDKCMYVIRVRTPRNDPRVPSIVDVVPGANNGEMEAYDLLGVYFEGNPNLRRGFLVPDDIAEKGVFPLRKEVGVDGSVRD